MFILCFLCIRYILKYFAWINSFISQQIHEVERQLLWCIARGPEDPDLIPGSERLPGEGNGSPLQYSYLENPMDREAWRATVHGVTKCQPRLSDSAHTLRHARTPGTHSPSSQGSINYMVLSRVVASVDLYFKRIPPFKIQISPLCVEGSLHRMNKDSFNFLV